MTDKEVMQQALKVLLHLQPTALTSFYTIGARDKSITALRQALEQKQDEPVAWKYRLVQIHDALSAHIGDTDPDLPEDMTDEEVREYEPVFWAAKEIADLLGDGPWDQYTRPQPAAWVGLTDEEHYTLADKAGCMSADWVDYAKSIEQALKEKNT